MDETAFLARFPRSHVPHPGPWRGPRVPADPARFAAELEAVGGSFVTGDARAAVQLAIDLEAHGRVVAARSAAPLLAGLNGWTTAPPDAAPHDLADVTLAILVAELAVTEGGALLVTAHGLPERALAFLAQRVLVLLPPGRLVGDQHDAQARLPRPLPHYATWISGPSKTADIEQTLVIGAHGPRALVVAPWPGS